MSITHRRTELSNILKIIVRRIQAIAPIIKPLIKPAAKIPMMAPIRPPAHAKVPVPDNIFFEYFPGKSGR